MPVGLSVVNAQKLLPRASIEAELVEVNSSIQQRLRRIARRGGQRPSRRQHACDLLLDPLGCGAFEAIEAVPGKARIVEVGEVRGQRLVVGDGSPLATILFVQAAEPIQRTSGRGGMRISLDMRGEQLLSFGRVIQPCAPAELPVRICSVLALRESPVPAA